MITFSRRKNDCLTRADKSSIGSWDKPILKLCEKINAKSDYYTLSSCSGRIVLIKNLERKESGMFVFRKHDKISFNELKNELNRYEGRDGLIFKQESCILHVACADLKSANSLLKLAQKAGWKHSGIISISENRVVCELIGSEQLALPIVEKGKLLVDDGFLKILVKEANDRLVRTWRKIDKLERLV